MQVASWVERVVRKEEGGGGLGALKKESASDLNKRVTKSHKYSQNLPALTSRTVAMASASFSSPSLAALPPGLQRSKSICRYSFGSALPRPLRRTHAIS